MKITKQRLREIIKEELTRSISDIDAIYEDPDVPMTDKEWLRMLEKVAGPRTALKVFQMKQNEIKGDGNE